MAWPTRLPALLAWAALCGPPEAAGGDLHGLREANRARWEQHFGEQASERSTRVFEDGSLCGSFSAARWKTVRCAQQCPYRSFSPTEACTGVCVSAAECRNTVELGGFPDDEEMMCQGCRVLGCKRCGSSRDECAECSVGLRLVDGATCEVQGKTVFHLLMAVLACIVGFFVLYIVSLLSRKAVNHDVLDTAWEERELSKLRDESVPGMPLYPLATLLTSDPISGRGVLLFFRHMLWHLVWVILATVAVAFIASYDDLETPIATRNDLCTEEGTAEQAGQLSEHRQADEAMFWLVVVLYVGGTIGSLVLVVMQRTAFRALDSGTTAMQDFALIAKGFPRERGCGVAQWRPQPPEQEYREFFEGVLGCRIVGVSVCWHYNQEREAVEKAIARELAELEWGTSFADSLKAEKKRPFLSSIDHFLCGIGGDESEDEPDSEEEPMQFNAPGMSATSARLATQFETSGYAIVVFHTKDDAQRALQEFSSGSGRRRKKAPVEVDDEHGHFGSSKSASSSAHFHSRVPVVEPWPQLSSATWVPHGSPRRRFRGQHKIELHRLPCGPGEICWENYGKHWTKVSKDISMGIMKVALFIVLWCILFYGPYAFFITFSSHAAGVASDLAGGLQGVSLGFVITIGNQLMYSVIKTASDRAGFHYSTMADNFNMVMYCVAVLINTLLDIWTVFMMADGERLDASFGERANGHIESLTKLPSMGEALGSELFAYLFPGTLLGPFLIEPVIYFCIAKVTCLVIQSRSGIGPKHAQEMLVLDRFEFSRYADNVINIMLVLLFLFFTSSRMFPAFIALVASIVYIFVLDSYRVLRGTQEHEMDLDNTESTAQFLLVMPCALLAACVAFRSEKTESLGFSSPVDGAVLLGFAHVAVHAGLVWILQMVVPNSSDEDLCADETYRDLARQQAMSWFNSNPVHCLRSKYLLGESPPCVFCAKGKEKLLRVNEAAGCFFDGPALARTIDKAALLKEEEFSFFDKKEPKTSSPGAPAKKASGKRSSLATRPWHSPRGRTVVRR